LIGVLSKILQNGWGLTGMKVELVCSVLPQVGKTTKGINTCKENPDRDHYFMTHDLKSVKRDFETKARLAGLNVTNSLDTSPKNRTYYNKTVRNRLEGLPYSPSVWAGLGNIKQLSNMQRLALSSRLHNIPQHVHIDEIHKFALEPNGIRKQRDNFLKILFKEEYVDYISLYTASGHDILMAPYFNFDSCTIISPYEGFKGIEKAKWHIKSQEYFNRIRNAFNLSEVPPTDFIDDLLEYPRMIVNIDSRNNFHDWIVDHIPQYKQYNQHHKVDGDHLTGGNSLGMSSTFLSNTLMLNRLSNTHRAAKWQAWGRALGKLTPHFICTQQDKDEMENYYHNMQQICREEIILMPGPDRAKYIENKLTWINPHKVANPKLKRITDSKKVPKPGSITNLVEKYISVYVGEELCNGKEWRNDGGAAANKVFQIFKEQNPDVVLPKDYIFKAIQDIDEVTKFRSGSRIVDVRVGQNYSRKGRAYVIIRTGEYTGTYSYYNYDQSLLSNETVRQGKIYVTTENRAAA